MIYIRMNGTPHKPPAIIEGMTNTITKNGPPDSTTRPLAELTDEELVSEHLDGRAKAFSELFRRYRYRLYRFIRKKTGDADRAQDLVQETFIRVVRHLHRFHTDRRFSTWIFTIAGNLTKNEFRNRSRSPLVLFQALEAGRDPDERPLEFSDGRMRPDDLYRKRELRHLVEEAIEGLTPRHRLIFRLREMEGRSYREISQITGVTLGTVKSRMHRAREAFRNQIEPSISS